MPQEELRKLLHYMERSSYENAVNEELMEIHSMVTEVKRDREVGLAYMKACEIKQQMLEEGRKAGLEEGKKAGLEEGRKEERARAEAEIANLKAVYEREKAESDARIAKLEAALREKGA